MNKKDKPSAYILAHRHNKIILHVVMGVVKQNEVISNERRFSVNSISIMEDTSRSFLRTIQIGSMDF